MKTMRLSFSASSCSLFLHCWLRLLFSSSARPSSLDGGDDHSVRVVLGKQTAHKGGGVGVLLDAAFLELVEFLPRLAIEVLAVRDEETFLDVRVVLQQRGGLERGERLAAAGGVPDVAVAAVEVDAVHDPPHCRDLIRAHHHELLLAGDEHHVAADDFAERAFDEEGGGKVVEVGHFFVRLVSGRYFCDTGQLLSGIQTPYFFRKRCFRLIGHAYFRRVVENYIDIVAFAPDLQRLGFQCVPHDFRKSENLFHQ